MKKKNKKSRCLNKRKAIRKLGLFIKREALMKKTKDRFGFLNINLELILKKIRGGKKVMEDATERLKNLMKSKKTKKIIYKQKNKKPGNTSIS